MRRWQRPTRHPRPEAITEGSGNLNRPPTRSEDPEAEFLSVRRSLTEAIEPLNQHDRVGLSPDLGQAEVVELDARLESKEVGVDDLADALPMARVVLDEDEGRTGHGPDPESAEEAPDEGGLTAAKVAGQPDDLSALQPAADDSPEPKRLPGAPTENGG